MPEGSIPPAELRRYLSHVFWMGGSPCSGKSSVARKLADEYGLRAYHCDEASADHQQRLTIDRQPMLHKWTHSSWNELWMRPVDILLAEAIACYQEHFQLVVKDLLTLPRSKPLLAEGTCLLPGSVNEVLSSRDQAIWIVPTETFQKAHYRDRGPWVDAILSECADPDRAFQNWMDRDAESARWVTRATDELGLTNLLVNGKRSLADNTRLVAEHFRL